MSRSRIPRNPKGGWLPPDPKNLENFYAEMKKESIRRFGVDENGNAYVTVELVDNSRQEPFSFEPIPRDIENSPYHPYGKQKWIEVVIRDEKTKKFGFPTHNPEEEEARRTAILENQHEISRMIMLNFSLANRRVEQLIQENEYDLHKEITRPERERLNRIKQLEHEKELYGDSVTYFRSRGYKVDVLTGLYWFDKADKKQLPVKPANFDKNMAELKKLKAYKPAKILTF